MDDASIPGAITEMVDDFLITKEVEEGRSANTIKAYRYDLLMFFRFLSAGPQGKLLDTIEKVQVTHVKRFLLDLNKRGYSKTAVARKIATLKSFFGHAVFMDYIETDPMARVKTPKLSQAEHLPKFLSAGEIAAVLEHVKENKWIQDYVMVRFMYATMCRVSELCGVTVRDIDTSKCIARLRGKGNKERLVPVDKGTVDLLKSHVFSNRESPDAPVFTNTRGGPIKPRVVQALFQGIKEELDFPEDKKLTPHVLRHTGATMLRRNGMDISELQDLLGHASPNTTRIYAKNDITRLNASYKKMHPLSTG